MSRDYGSGGGWDDRGPPPRQLSGLDKMYANTAVPVLVLFAFCCGIIALVLSAVAVGTCTDEKAQANAKLTLILGIVFAVIGVGISIIMIATNPDLMKGR